MTTDTRILDRRITSHAAYPVAAAWSRVLLAANDEAQLARALEAQTVLLRYLAAIAMADALASPGGDDEAGKERERRLFRNLERPSQGHWMEILRELCRYNVTPFSGELREAFWSGRRLTPLARELDALIELRNRLAHGASSDEASTAAPRIVEGLREVLGALSVLHTHRLVRVLDARPTRGEQMVGKLQMFVGQVPLTEPFPARWTARLVPDVLYLVAPDGSRFLDVTPFLEVRLDPALGQVRCLLIQRVVQREVELDHVETGSTVRVRPHGAHGETDMDSWLAERGHAEPIVATPELARVLGVADIPAVRLGSRFTVVRTLGLGGMAVVYEVNDALEGDRCALKVLREEFAADVEFQVRFRREAEIVRNIPHERILAGTELTTLPDGRLALRMPLMQGSAQDALKAGALPEDRVLRWSVDLLEALAHLHAHGVVHRDVKPSNLLVDSEGHVRLGDLGIALATGDVRLTRTMQRLGSSAYLAPECRGRHTGLPAADAYSAGLAIHELIMGDLPAGLPGKGIPAPLGPLIRRLCDADPDARATPAEALVALGRAPTAHLPPAPVSPASPASPAPPLQLALEPHAESTSWMVPLVMLVAAVVILFGVTWLVRP